MEWSRETEAEGELRSEARDEKGTGRGFESSLAIACWARKAIAGAREREREREREGEERWRRRRRRRRRRDGGRRLAQARRKAGTTTRVNCVCWNTDTGESSSASPKLRARQMSKVGGGSCCSVTVGFGLGRPEVIRWHQHLGTNAWGGVGSPVTCPALQTSLQRLHRFDVYPSSACWLVCLQLPAKPSNRPLSRDRTWTRPPTVRNMTDPASSTPRRMPPRTHSSFATRAAVDHAEQLSRRSSLLPSPSPGEETPLLLGQTSKSLSNRSPAPNHAEDHARKHPGTEPTKPRPGAFPRPVGGTSKLGTFAGVFVPTTLNVLSILMFLRFGFILGQAGVVGMMGEWLTSWHS